MNRNRGYVPIEIDGKELYLKLDFNAIALADQRIGGSAVQALGTGSFYAIQQLILVGLQNAYNDRKDIKAARNLDASKFDYYVDCILDALVASGIIKPDEEGSDDVGEDVAP